MNIHLPYPEFQLIKGYYGEKRAGRSNVPLINHILEGLALLQHIGDVSTVAQKAWVIHPLFQSDEALKDNYYLADGLDPFVVMLVMEYRYRANSWLSGKVHKTENLEPCMSSEGSEYILDGRPSAGSLRGVKAMLIADKVQNRKDFEQHHKGSHPRSRELEIYFNTWLEVLGVSEEQYQNFARHLDAIQRGG